MAISEDPTRLHRSIGSSHRTPTPTGKKKVSLHKSIRNETELHIPRAYLWKKGNVIIRGVYTGTPLFAVNYENGFQNHLQRKKWVGKNTLATISEIDPTGRVGRIVGLIRREVPKQEKAVYLYTYFPAFPGQPASFMDRDFCQNTMYRYGEFIQGRLGRQNHSFARAVGVTRDGQARMQIICETRTGDLSMNPIKRFAYKCKTDPIIELRDPQSGGTFFSRDQTTEITIIGQGQNMVVGVCLSYIMDLMANPTENEL